MKAKTIAKDLTLIQLFDRFGTDDKARAHLERVLYWPNGITPSAHVNCNQYERPSQVFRHYAKPESQDARRAALVFQL